MDIAANHGCGRWLMPGRMRIRIGFRLLCKEVALVTQGKDLMASGPARDAAAGASSPRIPAGAEDSPSRGAVQAERRPHTEPERRLHTEQLLALIAGERREHPLAPGLRQLAERIVYAALALLFPHFATADRAVNGELADELAGLRVLLGEALRTPDCAAAGATPEAVVEHLLARLGVIREALLLDAGAIYEGDPAAHSVDEVILA